MARSLLEGTSADREAAVALLSSLTIWEEHHDALLSAGVLPALLRTVEKADTVPQVGHRTCVASPQHVETCSVPQPAQPGLASATFVRGVERMLDRKSTRADQRL